MINYERAKRNSPKLKSGLTRARKLGYDAVLTAVKTAITEWEEWGAWPDGWSLWQSTLDRAALQEQKPYINIAQL